MATAYLCPICQQPLQLHVASNGYYCENKHHFDTAKEGYLNLLPVQHKKSKSPGDSRTMMRSRRQFLETGYYQALAEGITKLVDQYRTNDTMNILDMGCGEGYYCRQLQTLSETPDRLTIHGADIAKNAILAAAKKQVEGQFIVASNKRLPYRDQYFDLILRIYAPSDDAEIQRLLKAQGLLLMVTPGPRHLWQLKEFIYKKVNEHPIQVDLPDGFCQLEQQRICYSIEPDQENRMALLLMTPFAWRANAEIRNAIQHAHKLGGCRIMDDSTATLGNRRIFPFFFVA